MTKFTVRMMALAAALGCGLAPAAHAEQPYAGAYLAARQAGFGHDFERAAHYYAQSLNRDGSNSGLLESALESNMGLGDLSQAAPLAERLHELGVFSQSSNLVLMTSAGQEGDWARIFSLLEANRSVGPLVDGLAQGWAFVGQGKMTEALAAFDAVIEARGLKAFGLYHKALALASVGDFEGSDAIFSMTPDQGMQITRRSALAHAEVLSQLGRNTDAATMLTAVFGESNDPVVTSLVERLKDGETVAYTFVSGPTDGMAEVFYGVAAALDGEADEAYLLLYSRAAEILRPNHIEAILYSASLLERLGQFELANAAYARVPAEDPAFLAAELGRAGALRSAGQTDTAIEVLQSLSRSHSGIAVIFATLGDFLRQNGDMKSANGAYTQAISLYPANDPALWFVRYTRGITFEQLNDWAMAETDLRSSLELSPGQPSVLNYLGYSLVEKQEKLDEALSMIEQAAAAESDNGAIIDSLGWVQYRLGRYDDAIKHLERAAELEPVDPIVNDHLGDALWSVGRETEAKFQWQRALSFDPDPVDAERIRRKLAVGLDAVLAEEGAPPLLTARDDR